MSHHFRSRILPALFSSLVLSFALAPHAYAESTQLGRYLTVDNKPRVAQVDLLSQAFQVRFPASVQTIGDAMEYLLKQSGYSLVPEAKRSSELKIALSKPLPAVDRDFGPMKLKDGLATLAGPVFVLVNDPLNRMISFEISSRYAAIYQKTSTTNKHSVTVTRTAAT
jgi:type IV pili sensor histidine kinase/response regulator